MARPRNSTPSYLEHQRTGRARAVWTDGNGIRRERMLPGPFNSKESKQAFARLLLELESGADPVHDPDGITLNELFAAHLEFAEQHYRRADGSQTDEVWAYKSVYRIARQHYGHTPAAEFGPLALKAVRQAIIQAGSCRSTVNKYVSRLRRIFRWAAAEELIPFEVYQRLTAVPGLQRGRTEARESDPVTPVENAAVDATVKYLNRYVRGLVEFQRLTGCRPGEAVAIRRADIDTGGSVWLYRPSHHKLAHRGAVRIIAIGPRAQDLLREFFTPNLEDYLFSPRRAVEETRKERSAKRVTPRYPSHVRRNEVKRKGQNIAERYSVAAYRRAIERACLKAEVDPWHPNQLRHNFATAVRKAHGLEAAQVLLGHSKADVTQVYAERNQDLAAAVAAKIG